VIARRAALAPTGRASIALVVTARGFHAVDAHEGFAAGFGGESIVFSLRWGRSAPTARSLSAERKAGRRSEERHGAQRAGVVTIFEASQHPAPGTHTGSKPGLGLGVG